MKRLVIMIALLSVPAFGAFALDLSAGGGLSVATTSWNSSISSANATVTEKDAIPPIGAQAFFDATYLQVSTGFLLATAATRSGNTMTTSRYSEALGYLSFAALFKYPFDLDSIKVYPLFGVEYDLNILHGNPDYFEGSGGLLSSPTERDYDQLWLKAGIGADVLLGGKLFFRPELLFGVKLLNADEANVISAFQAAGYKSVSLTFLTIEIAVLVGYRL